MISGPHFVKTATDSLPAVGWGWAFEPLYWRQQVSASISFQVPYFPWCDLIYPSFSSARKRGKSFVQGLSMQLSETRRDLSSVSIVKINNNYDDLFT